MALNDRAADRVEQFLAAHPAGPLMVCVGSASMAGIGWLARHSQGRPVTLLIGDMKGRNFAKATDADRRAALRFVQRGDVTVLNWYRSDRSSQGRSEAHLKVWAVCDDAGIPQAFLVGSANLTLAGLHNNVELMTVADSSERAYLSSTLQQLRDNAKERLEDSMEHGDARDQRHHPLRRRSVRASSSGRHRQPAPAASTGCGPQVLAVASAAAVGAVLVIRGRTGPARPVARP